MFECNICLELASEPVVTRCGHMFCWRCLHQWMSTPKRSPVHGGLMPSTGSAVCPVCKAAVSSQTVTPIYTRGGDGDRDPRMASLGDPELPARPQGERLEPEPLEEEAAAAFAYGGSERYAFAAGYGHFPVLAALALSSFADARRHGGASARCAAVFQVPMASRMARLVVAALAGGALLSMVLM